MASVSTSANPRWEPTARWASRHREVVDAAAIAFAEKGFLGASTRDIADRLGIRAASLYYYLPSKDAALAAVCELGVRDFIENLRGILARPDPAADKLRAAVANRHVSPEDWARTTRLLKECGSIDYAYERAVEFGTAAKRHLRTFPDSQEREELMGLADYVLVRDR